MFLGVGMVSAFLLMLNLSYPLPWNDEATMMFLGKQLLETGHPSVWDGRNMMGYRNGHYSTEDLSFFYPPVPYTLAAISMAIFGVHDWSYRLLNCLLALVTLTVFTLVLRRELPQRPYVALLAFALVALQPAFLLFMRQANYYSFFMLANLCFYFSLRTWMRHSSGGHAWLAGSVLAGILSFITLYFGALWVLACGLIVLAENWRFLNKKRWGILIAAGLVWLAICCYHFFTSGTAGFADKYTAFLYNYSWPARKLLLFMYSLGASSELDTLPWPLGALALAVAGRHIWLLLKNRSAAGGSDQWSPLLRHLALCLTFMIILVFASFESPVAAAGIDIRYRHFLMPFFAIPGALMIGLIFNCCRSNKKQIPKWVYQIIPYKNLNNLCRALAVLIVFFTITTDYVSQPVSRHDFYKKPLADLYLYVRELVVPQADVVRSVVEAVDKLPLKEGDTLAIHTGGKLEYPPVVWQLSDKVLICCQIDRYSRNFSALAEVEDKHFLRLDPDAKPKGPSAVSGRPIYPKGENLYKASYIVIYRKYMPEVMDLGYRVVTIFPFTYYFAYSRPELRYHIYSSDFFTISHPSGEQLVLLQATKAPAQ